MTTGIMIHRNSWIIYAIPIIGVKQSIQNRLGHGFRERVGITSTPETVLHHGFGGLLYGRHSGSTFLSPPFQNRRLFALHFAVPKNITVMQFIN